jgi:nucleotide-binding universal stress UspA family protein
MYNNILIPTDGSELSEKAIGRGVALAKAFGAKITFVAVREPFQPLPGEPQMVVEMPDEYKKYVHDYLAADANGRLSAANSVAEQAGVSCETVDVEHDNVYQGILDAAAACGCDFIVMASHGRSGISGIVLGSVTLKVLTHSKLPVLVYR